MSVNLAECDEAPLRIVSRYSTGAVRPAAILASRSSPAWARAFKSGALSTSGRFFDRLDDRFGKGFALRTGSGP